MWQDTHPWVEGRLGQERPRMSWKTGCLGVTSWCQHHHNSEPLFSLEWCLPLKWGTQSQKRCSPDCKTFQSGSNHSPLTVMPLWDQEMHEGYACSPLSPCLQVKHALEHHVPSSPWHCTVYRATWDPSGPDQNHQLSTNDHGNNSRERESHWPRHRTCSIYPDHAARNEGFEIPPFEV